MISGRTQFLSVHPDVKLPKSNLSSAMPIPVLALRSPSTRPCAIVARQRLRKAARESKTPKRWYKQKPKTKPRSPPRRANTAVRSKIAGSADHGSSEDSDDSTPAVVMSPMNPAPLYVLGANFMQGPIPPMNAAPAPAFGPNYISGPVTFYERFY